LAQRRPHGSTDATVDFCRSNSSRSGSIPNTDKADPNIIINEITTIDNVLKRPWTAVKKYRRIATKDKAIWPESVCAEGNNYVEIAGQNYYLGADGLLMPARKNQLRHFK
jgi:hypothetical protein